MHTGEYPAIRSIIVPNAETEQQLAEEGWTRTRPFVPDGTHAEADEIDSQEAFETWKAGIESRLTHLEGLAGVQKRKPGRPRKTEE